MGVFIHPIIEAVDATAADHADIDFPVPSSGSESVSLEDDSLEDESSSLSLHGIALFMIQRTERIALLKKQSISTQTNTSA